MRVSLSPEPEGMFDMFFRFFGCNHKTLWKYNVLRCEKPCWQKSVPSWTRAHFQSAPLRNKSRVSARAIILRAIMLRTWLRHELCDWQVYVRRISGRGRSIQPLTNHMVTIHNLGRVSKNDYQCLSFISTVIDTCNTTDVTIDVSLKYFKQ